MKAFLDIRRAGVPLIAWETADPAATITQCTKAMNGTADKTPIFEWNCVTGLRGLNEAGREAMQKEDIDPILTTNPTECLGMLATKASAKVSAIDDAIIYWHMANRLLEAERIEGLGFCQGVWLCRDVFKAKHITLIMLAPGVTLPTELKQDVVTISEPLPGDDELAAVCESVIADAEMDVEKALGKNKPKITETLRGLSAFAAEQVVAMSLRKNGIDMPELMKLKRSYISQLPGVEVRSDKITFDDIAGYDAVKTALQRKIKGKRPPRLILWLDELERALAGNQSDSSGTTQDFVGTILTWIQDRLNEDRLSATMFVGFPGVSKSAISMAAKNEAECECLRLDLGGMKDSLVGSSEKRIRNVLKVVDAMSGGHILVIASCNSVQGLPAPLISRFAFGVWFFDLPQAEEGTAIWKIKRKKYSLSADQPNPTDDPWTGREIQQCCFLADDLNIPLKDAAKYITPYCMTNTVEIEQMRRQAHKRWLSASKSGFYTIPQQEAVTGRRVQV